MAKWGRKKWPSSPNVDTVTKRLERRRNDIAIKLTCLAPRHPNGIMDVCVALVAKAMPVLLALSMALPQGWCCFALIPLRAAELPWPIAAN